jgi:uncharacterized protein (DUF433 family)
MIATGYRYIVRTPGAETGRAVIEGTRIGVHQVIGLLQDGETVSSLPKTSFPNITRAQIYECLAYYEDHRAEINALLECNDAIPDADFELTEGAILEAERRLQDLKEGRGRTISSTEADRWLREL